MTRGQQTLTRWTTDAARLTLLLLAPSCWAGCAKTTAHKPEAAPVLNERSSVDGPACVGTGPGVDVAVTSYIPGKPPHETFVTELHVRNPRAVPVWLLYDVGHSFPRIVTSVVLSRTTSGSAAHVWSFSGDGSFEAVRIPGDGDVVLRNVEISCMDCSSQAALVFASRISIGGRSAEGWFGRPGLLPTRGDFDLTPLSPTPPVTEHEWHVDSLNAPAGHIDVICVSHVNLAASIRPTP